MYKGEKKKVYIKELHYSEIILRIFQSYVKGKKEKKELLRVKRHNIVLLLNVKVWEIIMDLH